MGHDVFISHSAKNKVTADAVCAMLESRGVRCWIAPRDVTPGTEWGESIVEAIEQARIMVLVFTADANASPQIRREVERAVNRGVTILPLRMEDILPGKGLEYFIGNVHWLDAMTPPLENHLKQLAETIKMLLARTDRKAPVPGKEKLSSVAQPEEVVRPAMPSEAVRADILAVAGKWKFWRWLWLLVTLGVLAEGFRVALFVVPPDSQQGDVQRIFYYHIPSWAGMGLFFAINLGCSLVYLAVRNRNHTLAMKADSLAVASAEMGVVFCFIGLVTGSLWGRAVWGIWWTWDARLTSTLVLWLIYVAYLLLRRFAAGPQMRTLAAVMAIFGYLDVPLVYMSTRWWRTQHPAPVFGGAPGSGIDSSMMPAVWWNLAGWLMWGIFVASLRYVSEYRAQKAEQDEALWSLEFAPAPVQMAGGR